MHIDVVLPVLMNTAPAAAPPVPGRRPRPPQRAMAVLLHFLVASIAWFPAGTAGQDNISIGGQLRSRYETRDAGIGEARTGFVSMRTRVEVSAAVEEGLAAFIQFQDVRRWGEENGPLSDYRADNLDLHQAYVHLEVGTDDAAVVRIGRQEIVLGEERLLGSVNWTQQGQSFDGMRGWLTRSWGRLDLFALTIRDEDPDGSVHFLGAQLGVAPRGNDTLETYLLHDRGEGDDRTRQTTLGVRWAGSISRLLVRGEAAFQTGTRDANDVSAYLASLRLGLPIREGRVLAELGYDHLSGDSAPGDDRVEVFHTLYATNHKFYGFADLFLNIPRDTGGGGLRDFVARVTVSATPRVSLSADLHSFDLASKIAGSPGHLGDELDLTIRATGLAGLGLTGGLSAMWGGSALETLGRLEGNLVFGFLMLDVSF